MAASSVHAAPLVVPLWPEGPPEPEGFKIKPENDETLPTGIYLLRDVSVPTITVYRPEKPNGTAVLVCPGGGYNVLAYEHEGTQVCEWFNSVGVTAVLLKYRVGRRSETDPSAVPLQDAQRAMGLIQHNAREWGIRPDRVGMLGFSAGANLTLMLALHPNQRTYRMDPKVDVEDVTPAFIIPVYPGYLVDKNAPFVLRKEIQVTAKSPPICLIHAHDDDGGAALPTGSALLYLEYKKLNRPAELHIYAKGGHGFGLKPKGIPTDTWLERVGEWMGVMGWMTQD